MPYWRKIWGMLYAPVCRFHRVSLSVHHSPNLTPSKAWMAFLGDCQVEGDTNLTKRRAFSSDHEESSAEIIRLATRVQVFLVRIFYRLDRTTPTYNVPTELEWLQTFIAVLFSNFLYPRTRTMGPDGLARMHQMSLPRYEFRTVAQARAYALAECDPYARIVSLILIGRILDIVTESEMARIRGIIGMPAAMRTPLCSGIGFYGIKLRSSHEVKVWKHLLERCPVAYCEQVGILASKVQSN